MNKPIHPQILVQENIIIHIINNTPSPDNYDPCKAYPLYFKELKDRERHSKQHDDTLMAGIALTTLMSSWIR